MVNYHGRLSNELSRAQHRNKHNKGVGGGYSVDVDYTLMCRGKRWCILVRIMDMYMMYTYGYVFVYGIIWYNSGQITYKNILYIIYYTE